MSEQVAVRWEAPHHRSVRRIGPYRFAPPDHIALVDAADVEELLTQPFDTFELVDAEVAEVLAGYEETPDDSGAEENAGRPTPEEEELSGTVPDVEEYVAGIDDPELLARVRWMEEDGANRVTVLRAVDSRLAELEEVDVE